MTNNSFNAHELKVMSTNSECPQLGTVSPVFASEEVLREWGSTELRREGKLTLEYTYEPVSADM